MGDKGGGREGGRHRSLGGGRTRRTDDEPDGPGAKRSRWREVSWPAWAERALRAEVEGLPSMVAVVWEGGGAGLWLGGAAAAAQGGLSALPFAGPVRAAKGDVAVDSRARVSGQHSSTRSLCARDSQGARRRCARRRSSHPCPMRTAVDLYLVCAGPVPAARTHSSSAARVDPSSALGLAASRPGLLRPARGLAGAARLALRAAAGADDGGRGQAGRGCGRGREDEGRRLERARGLQGGPS